MNTKNNMSAKKVRREDPANYDPNKLTVVDNAELRYNVNVGNSLWNKLAKYYRLKATANDLCTAMQDNEDKHPWKQFLTIAGEQYEVAYRECSFTYITALPDPDNAKFLLSVRKAKDGRTRIVLVIPWHSYAAKHNVEDDEEINWMEY